MCALISSTGLNRQLVAHRYGDRGPGLRAGASGGHVVRGASDRRTLGQETLWPAPICPLRDERTAAGKVHADHRAWSIDHPAVVLAGAHAGSE